MRIREMYYKFPYIILPATGLVFSGAAVKLVSKVTFFDFKLLAAVVSQTIFLLAAGIIIRRLYHHSYTDPLTGLGNRRYFDKQFKAVYQQAKRTNEPFSVALIDADNFKLINDTYGHSAGDKVLVSLSMACQKNTRAYDVSARLGGDEFAVIFPCSNLSAASTAAERIRRAVEQDNEHFCATVSIGVVAVDAEEDSMDILEVADKTLYKAKQRRNSVAVTTFTADSFSECVSTGQ